MRSTIPRLLASSAVSRRLAAASAALLESFHRMLAHPSGEITE